MNIIDYVVVGSYLLMICGLGLFYSKSVQTANDYYVGTKTAPWWAIGLSVLATYVSALSFLGGPAWAYGDGMAAMAIHIQYPLVLFVCVAYFIPFFYKSGLVSIYDYFEKRFGKKTKLFMSLLFMVATSIAIGSILTATGIAASYATGMNPEIAILVMISIACLYTILGGMNAVIWTDVLQSFIFIGVALFVFFSLIDGNVFTSLDEVGKLKQNWSIDPAIASTMWAGVIAMTFYHITVYGAGQMMVQRVLAAKSIGDAKKAYLFVGYAAFFVYLMFFMIGGMLYLYYDGAVFDNTNTIILEYVSGMGIAGLLGLVIVAVLSASMSSESSALNSLTTVTMNDFFPNKDLSFARKLTFGWAIISALVAMQFLGSTGSILETLSAVGSYFVGAKFAAFYLGFFSKRVKERELLIGILIGFIGVAGAAVYTDIAWPWYAVIGSLLTIIPAEIIARSNLARWHKYSVPGQQAKYKDRTEDGWYLAPGKFEKPTQGLIALFVVILLCINLI